VSAIEDSRRELSGTDQVYPQVTFDVLPDYVLLEMFDFYLAIMAVNLKFYHFISEYYPKDAWHTLVQVCKRWRSIVFASPHRLKLQLLCTINTPVQNKLDIWPELPIVIGGCVANPRMAIMICNTYEARMPVSKPQNPKNIIAALKQHDRVAKVDMGDIPTSLLARMRAMEMREPFSALTYLRLHSQSINASALPDSFLGGSAPRLQTLSLRGIPFPALPNLLLSTHDLVTLELSEIPLSGYISPDAMVACLSASTRLKTLHLEFKFPRSRPDRENRHVPRLTRAVLPALTFLEFKGDSEYLEDIVAQIDTPLLTRFQITLVNRLVYDTPLLHRFISRTEMFKAHRAELTFCGGEVKVKLYPRNGDNDNEISSLAICKPFYWPYSSVSQVCDLALSTFPTLDFERLEINMTRSWENVEDAQWVELLHPFTYIKDLVLRGASIQCVTPALEQLAGGSVTEMLPALQNILLEGTPEQPSEPVKKMIGKFVAARQLSGRSVSVHHRESPSLTWQQMRWEVGD